MKREIDVRLAIGAIALLVVIVSALAWWKFKPASGPLTAAEAGLGKPMHPGEIPGQRSGVPEMSNQTPPTR